MQTNKKFELRCGFPQAMIEARCPKVPRGKAGKPPRAKGATAEAPGQLPLAGRLGRRRTCGGLSRKA